MRSSPTRAVPAQVGLGRRWLARRAVLRKKVLKLLVPGSDAAALLSEVRERIADELDYEIEAQRQRRLAGLFRGHPHVRVPRVHTDLSTRRVLVTEYVDGPGLTRSRGLRRPSAGPPRRSADQPASATNTFAYTLDLSACLRSAQQERKCTRDEVVRIVVELR